MCLFCSLTQVYHGWDRCSLREGSCSEGQMIHVCWRCCLNPWGMACHPTRICAQHQICTLYLLVVRQEKGAHTQTFGSGYLWWGGVLLCEGVRAKKCMSLETQGNQTFCRISRDSCRDIPEVPAKIEKKLVFNFLAPMFHLRFRTPPHTKIY